MRQTLRSDEPHRREEGADAARITGEQGQMGDIGVRADEEMSEAHQDRAALRVRRNQLSVSPLTFPPRSSAASTRLPRESLLALTTSTPSGWSTNSTSRCGSSPCFFRMAGGMVTWPLPVIFTQTLWLRLVPNVNRPPVLSFRKSALGALSSGRPNPPAQNPGGSGDEWPGGVDLCPDAMHQAMTGSESEAEHHWQRLCGNTGRRIKR
jgi:hypothetical protein